MSLNIEKANLPTGSDALLFFPFSGSISPEVTLGTTGSELEALRDRTGEDTKAWRAPVLSPPDSLPLGTILGSITCYGQTVDSFIRTFLYQGGSLPEAITGYYITFRSVVEAPKRTATEVHKAELRGPSLRNAPALRLREIAGVGIAELAAIFGVSRPTFHKWMTGTIPRRRHRDHLSQTLAIVEEVSRRMGNPQAVSAWLNSPVSVTGTRPLDLLRTKQFLSLRGYLSKRAAERAPLQPAFRPSQKPPKVKPVSFNEALEMLRPRRWESDEESDD